jgi:hypothetical protein
MTKADQASLERKIKVHLQLLPFYDHFLKVESHGLRAVKGAQRTAEKK